MTSRPGKRDRLVAAASELIHHQGLASTTLADIALASDVPVGNLYYYFKTKEALVDAVVHSYADQLRLALAELERVHRTPKVRLKAMVGVLAEQRDLIARFGCRYGTLSSELAKRSDGSDSLGIPLMQIPLGWAQQQFRELGHRDAHDLAVDLVAAYQGSAVLSCTLGQPDLMARQCRRIAKWIDSLQP